MNDTGWFVTGVVGGAGLALATAYAAYKVWIYRHL